MENPSHLLIDTDSLIQLFISRQRDLLAKLRQRCGIQAAVLPEVEAEIRWHQKFKNQFELQFLATIKSGNLVVLEREDVRKLMVARGCPTGSVEAHLQALDQRCQDYHSHVGEGEAYSHATAATLGLPVMSNDGAALTTLLAQGKQVACPTLRFFDLLIFARSVGWIDDATGEAARSLLERQKEHLPPPFRAKGTFALEWPNFACRLSSVTTQLSSTPTTPRSTLHLQLL